MEFKDSCSVRQVFFLFLKKKISYVIFVNDNICCSFIQVFFSKQFLLLVYLNFVNNNIPCSFRQFFFLNNFFSLSISISWIITFLSRRHFSTFLRVVWLIFKEITVTFLPFQQQQHTHIRTHAEIPQHWVMFLLDPSIAMIVYLLLFPFTWFRVHD